MNGKKELYILDIAEGIAFWTTSEGAIKGIAEVVKKDIKIDLMFFNIDEMETELAEMLVYMWEKQAKTIYYKHEEVLDILIFLDEVRKKFSIIPNYTAEELTICKILFGKMIPRGEFAYSLIFGPSKVCAIDSLFCVAHEEARHIEIKSFDKEKEGEQSD